MGTIKISENIENHILSEINKAETSLDIAVAWITSKRIIEKILEKKNIQGLSVRILCWKDKDSSRNNNFLKKSFGKRKAGKWEIYEVERMHDKFCIIDEKKVINGSYNWTEAARNNTENIEISDEITNILFFQNKFDKIRHEIIKRFDDKKFKENVLEETRNQVGETLDKKINDYISELARRNQEIFKQEEQKIQKQKSTIEVFEKRTNLYRKILIFCIILLLLSLGILAISVKMSSDWYSKSILTKQEAKQELLNEFESQNLKLYDVNEYQKIQKNNEILEEWISKNPRDSKKFIEYRKNNLDKNIQK